MLSLHRAWLGPDPRVARPAPPPGALRPVPRRAPPPSPPPARPASPASSEGSVDVERVEASPAAALVDVAACDGPVRFSRVRNAAWDAARRPARAPHYYPCKSCGSRFPSYYFVHKHRKRCHADEPAPPVDPDPSPGPSTSAAAN